MAGSGASSAGVVRCLTSTPQLDKIVRVPDSTRLVREYLSQWRSNYLFADADANLWIGLRRRGLIRFNPRTYAVEKVFDRPGEAVRWITQDRQGTIWFTTGAGVYAYNPISRRLKQYQDELGAPNRRSSDLANGVFALGIHARRDGTILVGMFNEVDVIHPTTGQVTRLELIPLRANVDRSVFDFHDDPQGNTYFIASTAGYRYTARGELQQLEFGGLTHPIQYLFSSRNNRLWVMAGRKLYEYDLTRVRPIPALNLLDVVINGNRLSAPTAQRQLVRDSLGHPTLTVQEGDLINLHVSPYIERLTQAFRLRLAGYDRQWSVIEDAANTVSYELSAGTYTLQANRFVNPSGWEKDVANLTIIVQPPFWKTGWFWAFALTIVGSIGTGLIRSWNRRRKLRQELAQRAFETATLRQMDVVKTRFFSNVTHEFRTPLTIILNATEQLTAKAPDLNEQPEVATIQRHAHQLLRLITETLDIARLDAGKLETHLQLGNPVWFIGQVVAQFAGLATQRSIGLTYNTQPVTHSRPAPDVLPDGTPADDALCSFDGEKWEKIAYNLLANALKFTPAGGHVQVTGLIQADNCFVLRVTDTGIGIPEDQQERIFERFHQVDTRSTRAYSGTGIGLALVRELATWLGGRVTVKSQPDQGSTFTVELPLTTPDQAHPTAPTLSVSQSASEPVDKPASEHAASANGAPPKPLVLVVEDNEDLRAQVVDYLSGTCQVLSAENGRLGWEQALAQIPDLIVSDVMMPELDGYELLERLKSDERTSHIPVILLTARSAPESRMQGLQTGADDYLTKPFSLAELVLRISNGLRTRQNWQKRFLATPTPAQLPVEPVPDREEAFLNRLRQGILAQLDSDALDVDWLATQAHMSRTQLNRKLSALTSLSPNRFIQRVRLERAVELLQTGELNVTQVAYQVGYNSPSHFAKVFQEHFGYAPAKMKEIR